MVELKINERFRDACPKLSDEELSGLESLILSDEVIFNPIITWNDVIIDGHNRYDIAKRNNIEFTTKEILFDSDEEAIVWIKKNAMHQRNLTDLVKYELTKEIEVLLLNIGKKKESDAGKVGGRGHKKGLSQITNPLETHNTRDKLSKETGISKGQLAKLKVIEKEADEETKEKLRKGETTVGKVYNDLKKPKIEIHPVVIILENGASGLERWVKKHSIEDVMDEFINPIKKLIKEIRNKKATYGI